MLERQRGPRMRCAYDRLWCAIVVGPYVVPGRISRRWRDTSRARFKTGFGALLTEDTREGELHIALACKRVNVSAKRKQP
ncbi:hypothetical protein BD410DRAFT_176444 [Rickenella mellea]|uniref:Uncharacterized protein n=1 Tax=Rickenella mellea TaxID=50990 RepID=A0A4Y7Q756_9AGAM|nr:hypothetical protein BD410DRAFT_176444 [Rickenella mellea]